MAKTTVAAAFLLWLLTGSILGCGDDSTPEPPRAAAPASEPAEAPEPSLRPEGPPSAISETLRENDRLVRIPRLAEVLRGLGPEHVTDAQKALADARLDLGAPEIELLLRYWSSYEPKQAAEWASTRVRGAYRGAALLPTVEAWARQDPWAALQFIQAMRVGRSDFTEIAEIGLIRGWYDSGDPGIEDYLVALGPSFEQQRAVALRARLQILREGADPTMDWAKGLPEEDPKFKLAVYRQLGSELGKLAPEDGVRWCTEVCDGPFGDGVSTLIAQRWAAQDGPAAMTWVSQRPSGPQRESAARGAFRGWWRKDPDGLHAWIAELARTGFPIWFQPALSNYASSVAMTDAVEGMKWALLLEDDYARRDSMLSVAMKWKKQDESAAEAWLADSPLSEEDRDRVRNPEKYRNNPLRKPEPGADAP